MKMDMFFLMTLLASGAIFDKILGILGVTLSSFYFFLNATLKLSKFGQVLIKFKTTKLEM